jgi:DUF1680 family protein
MRHVARVNRRRFLQAAALLALAGKTGSAATAPGKGRGAVTPFPLAAIRLKPSPFLEAQEANRAYLARLEPDRLLHNFRAQAGLTPKCEAYGGWERESIAGHTLGHYLSACSLMHAQAGDRNCRTRVRYIVSELDACQRAHGDGYVAGFTRRAPDGTTEPGRRVFDEIARGDIRASRFDLNGCWAPFYNWHKLLAGLLDAERYCGAAQALPIASGLAGYVERSLAPLDDEMMQAVLATEFGGMSDALAELGARTGERRFLALARRFHHRVVLDPLIAGRDELSHLHANTQIPKIIGLARRYGLEGDPAFLAGADFFWRTVTERRSYVIGGHGDRENFQEPGSISRYVTEQTCESCNTYNMLKLTRLLYAAQPRATWFDYYERAHLNHILAQHRPTDGMFTYMMPLLSGAAREYSTPFDSFWCCVGTGMESHAKHGDSIFWRDADTLYVNLFIPAHLDWQERNASFSLETAYPFDERVVLRVESLRSDRDLAVALRSPAWCDAPHLALNGRAIGVAPDARGYLVLRRRWRAGDSLELGLPMKLRVEPTPDDDRTVALLHGPLVLAADLGPAAEPFDGTAPAFVGDDPIASLVAVDRQRAVYRSRGVLRPSDRVFSPFFSQRDRRSAVYFKRHTPAGWQGAVAAAAAERERRQRLDARSADVIRLGDEADEARHGLVSALSYAVTYRFRPGRDARAGGYFEFDARLGNGPFALQATYWGGERDRTFVISADGTEIATECLHGEESWSFIEREYSIPRELTIDRRQIRIRFEPQPDSRAGPVFGCRVLARQA